MSAIPVPVAKVPLNWLDPAPGAFKPLFPMGPAPDFGGAIFPNPDNVVPLRDTDSATRLTGGTLSADNFHGKAAITKVGSPAVTPQQDWFAANAPKAAAAPQADWFEQNAPKAAASPAAKESTASHITNEFLSGLGIGSKEDAKNFFEHPINTLMDSFKAQGDLAMKAKDAYKRGDYTNAVIHGLNYLVPFIGQQTDKAGEQMQQGDIAGGLARTAGVAGSIVGGAKAPEVVPEVTSRMPAMAQLAQDKGAAILRAGAKAGNKVIERVPEVAGGTAGAYVGHATGIPEGGFLGALAGRTLGKELLSPDSLPRFNEHFGLPDRVTGGPATVPLGDLLGDKAPAPIAPKITPKAVETQISDALGGKPLQKNVPLRAQVPALQKPAAAAPAANALPEGFTAVESSALKGFKYDAATREFSSITKDGRQYVHGDVSPEEAQAFIEADSKGKAWAQLKSQNPLVAKVVNGKRVATLKPQGAGSATPDDLTSALQDSLRQAIANKEAGAPRYVYRARDVGEEGVPVNDFASATSDAEQAKTFAKPGQRSPNQGQVVRIDLSKLSPKDYVIKQHPDGPFWVKFTRPLTESEVSYWAGARKDAGK